MITHTLPQREPAHAATVRDWRGEAIASHRRTQREGALTQGAELASQVRRLTGLRVTPDSIYVDHETGRATVAADGSIFRLAVGTLALLRPCAYCGTGQFASPPIEDPADLGFALIAWQPLHDDCRPSDPADWR
jgi:hypothetical protein